MGRGQIAFVYKRMSPENQRAFNRWLKANAILGSIFTAGIIAWQWLAPCRRAPVMRRSPAVRALPVAQCRNRAAGRWAAS
jgi:hypothetical protein